MGMVAAEIPPTYESFADRKWDLVYLGRLSHEKRPLLFLEAVSRLRKRLSGLRAIMIGDGPERANVEAYIEDRLLDSAVSMTGWVEDPLLYLHDSRVMLVTSAWEGMSLAALEAMAAGVPVVCLRVGGIEDLLAAGGGIVRDNPRGLVDSCESLLTDRSLWQRLSQEARARAQEVNDPKRFVGQLERLYDRALQGR
jgi:glycosyltransferase involved in cell wall biosynthesis